MSGTIRSRQNGRARTPDQALSQIEKMQNVDLFPTYFSPELFASILQMIQNARTRAKNKIEAAKVLTDALAGT